MTIALGALSRSSFILAADQQEGTGYAGDLKMRVGKIAYACHAFSSPVVPNVCRTICVTGCGDTAYLNFLKKDIIDAFMSEPHQNLATFYVKLQEIVFNFWAEHITPLSTFSHLNLEALRLIIAAQALSERKLWVTSLNAIRESADGFEAVGSGERWAKSVSKSIFYNADEKLACRAAAYAVFTAINRAEGCGGDIDIISVQEGFPSEADPDALRELNTLFRRYENIEHGMRRAAMGSRSIYRSMEGFQDSLESLKKEIDAINLFPLPTWAEQLALRPTMSGPQKSEDQP